ncbi:hypothetical protein DFR52_101213 [Hoeflea marina]|uniref:Uncharacterized protein n=1 Tax=Hoeflea marina TaxID=274592 RepID=A0A317PPY6_9HYPH|nr:hypothetical protein [Hoeflea marina]PWW03532.1 hypothetical protein DFR52_101213 [Hoeflea marina]
MPTQPAYLTIRPALKLAALLALLGQVWLQPALAQAAPGTEIETLSDRVMFVVSGGFWEGLPNEQDGGAAPADGAAPDSVPAAGAAQAEPAPATGAAADTEPAPEVLTMQKGYYRIAAVRAQDNHSLFYLQQVALGEDGPDVVMSMEIAELSDLKGYVTDIRPEDSSGSASQPGFAAYVHMKPDLETVEPETWSVLIDDLGDITVSRADN